MNDTLRELMDAYLAVWFSMQLTAKAVCTAQ